MGGVLRDGLCGLLWGGEAWEWGGDGEAGDGVGIGWEGGGEERGGGGVGRVCAVMWMVLVRGTWRGFAGGGVGSRMVEVERAGVVGIGMDSRIVELGSRIVGMESRMCE